MKQLIKNYTFDKTAKTVTFSDFASIRLERVLLITNVTAGVIVYQFNNPSLGGAAAGNTLTLAYDTSAMANTDNLQIIYDCLATDPLYDSQPIGGNVASGAADSGNPVKVGGKYNASGAAVTDGQRGDLQIDAAARLIVSLGTILSGEDLTNNVLGIQRKPVVGSQYAPGNYSNAGTVTKANVKATTGNVLAARATNANASPRYLQLHNSSSAPTAGATAQLYFLMPPGSATSPGILMLTSEYFAPSEYFSSGISWAVSTTATTFTDAATASDHLIQFRYI